MTSVNRFIQFNNETIDANMLLRMERLAQALAEAPYLKVTNRKLMEFRPSQSALSISVFWRHRPKHIEMNGYLSDVYLLSAGFWRDFDLRAFKQWHSTETALPELREQLLLCAEEFRLSESIMKSRPGTKEAFAVRETVYRDFHENQYRQNRQKGFAADAFLSAAYLTLHGTRMPLEENAELLHIWTHLFDARSTADSLHIVEQVMARLEAVLEKDMVHQFYTFGEPALKAPPVREHEGAEGEEAAGETVIETIEEWFQTWHRETEDLDSQAMEYELNEGQTQLAEGGREEEGRMGEELQTARGQSQGEPLTGNDPEDRSMPGSPKRAKGQFGAANEGVVFTEKRLEIGAVDKQQIEARRTEQARYVKPLLKELQKRISQRREQERHHLSAGRLSKNLLPLVTEDRPKPFYRKTAPSKRLDAVFGLLVDGSASMIDKMDETKRAVLLFHDVLRALDIPHEIVLFYEDAFEAAENRQPNYFEWVHKFEDGSRDNASAVFSMEAHEDNRDGFAIRWMAKRMMKRSEKHRFLLVFSDGEPSAYNYAESGVLDTTEAVAEAHKKAIHVLHLFLSDAVPGEDQQALFQMMFGSRSISADSLDSFTEKTLHMLKRALHLVVQST